MSPVGTDTSSGPFRGDVRSPWRWLLVAAALTPTLWLTLTPGGDDSVVPSFLFCVLCGAFGGANLVRNVVLFLPLGAALALLIGPGRWAFLGVLGITAAIEVLQFHVPGRNPMLADVAANFTGGAISVLLVRWFPFWSRLSRPRAAGLSLILGAGSAAILLLTAYFFAPELPRTAYWGQWTPVQQHLVPYEGRVVSATVDGIPSRSWRLQNPDAVRAAILAGGPVRVEAVAGPPPPGLAPIFSIYDAHRREVLLLGADGHDLVGRLRFRANRARLDRPDLRVPGAFREVEPGDPVNLEFRTRGGDSCLTLNERTECGLGPRLERGWALLLYPGSAPAWFHRLLDFGWMLALVLPFAFFARGHALSFVGGGLILGAAAAGWWMPAVAPPSILAWLGAGVGLLAGTLTVQATRRLAGRTGRPPNEGVASSPQMEGRVPQ